MHRHAQIVGKVQLALTPVVNHFWNVPLQLTARGLATVALHRGARTFDVEIDLVGHRVAVRVSDGRGAEVPLRPLAVADFYRELMAALESLGVGVPIWTQPVEIAVDAIPFP